ncbi:tryptophan-rich antigen [Plasmodium brasilianum]|uniref:Tryptophan-rich antigen n=1 Tax=Plasmodium brasilianum TaxID=5824 RepID=A0ACB9YC33_PLABR|nr:tryptophan-rich antigen [Plasmodium brasilianum]
MEPIKDVEGFMPDTSFLRNLTVKNRNHAFSDENLNYPVSEYDGASNAQSKCTKRIGARNIRTSNRIRRYGVGNNWNEWIKNTQHKWMHYNENMEKEYNSDIMKRSKNWNGYQWKEWINEEGKSFIEKDFERWINAKKSYF